MPVIPPLTNEAASIETQQALAQLQVKLGQVPNMYRTFAHAPKVLDAAISMGHAIRSELNPKVRELAYLKVIQLTDCFV